jgi:hypothetical protein
MTHRRAAALPTRVKPNADDVREAREFLIAIERDLENDDDIDT